MEKRLLIAVLLMTAVILLTNRFFPPPKPPEAALSADTVAAAAPTATAALPGNLSVPTVTTVDTFAVETDLYRYSFVSLGGAIIGAELRDYPSYTTDGSSVQLVPRSSRFFAQRIAVGSDTIDLRALPFTGTRTAGADGTPGSLDFVYADSTGFGVSLKYTFDPTQYVYRVSGRVSGLGGRPASLLTDIGPGLEPHEAVDHHSERELAVVLRSPGEIDRHPFRRLKEPIALDTTVTWAGIKDKYFLAVMMTGEGHPFAGGSMVRQPDTTVVLDSVDVIMPQAVVTTSLPIAADGSFSYAAYLGPQDYRGLKAVGMDLENATPYGYRWLQPVIKPLAEGVLWVLNQLHESVGLAYGWVLVVFGVMMRIVLWPLNAKAMRAQMKNMAVQPLIQEVRDKYAKDPEKQQAAMLALYKEHGFNPLGGCLPMLIPFPVLITLYFVFQNTIAFRGAEFLWLGDLSLRDPYYILPVIAVGSMFALQLASAKISGIEQNAQMKMMMYLMPLMMGFIFFMFPAGLNLYYGVTQIASAPQQLLIARERGRAQAEMKKTGGPKLPPLPTPARPKSSKGKRS